MSLINQQAFEFAKKDLGLLEYPGDANNSKIVLMHQTTELKSTQDSVPWCSSAMNYWMCLSILNRNPKAATVRFTKNMTPQTLQKLFQVLGKTYGVDEAEDTGLPICEPTFDAWARSWLNFGYSVKKNPQPGDICIFSRGADSGHVAFYNKGGLLSINCLGGNQSDSVCYADYLKIRLIDIRRSYV